VTAGSAVLMRLESVGLHFSLNGLELPVLTDFNISILPGEFVAIVGPSGCGKSTLLRVINGLIQPSTGSIEWAGQSEPDDGQLRSAMVFQSPRLLPWKTVVKNVAIPLRCRGVSKRQALDRSRELLKVVDVAEFANAYPRQLSGGMQQRVNLARALAASSDLILLDEPFAALDSLTRDAMQEYLARIWSGQKKAGLLVTHQVDEAIFLADRVIVLSPRPARIVAEVPVDFPKPRRLAIKQLPEFAELKDTVFVALRESARDHAN
jgi:NitT/TauT family transport system ATP-binding protein